jgi:hypothetical protein
MKGGISMRNSSFSYKLIVAAVLALTLLVFGPVSSQAVEVMTNGSNTATGIKDLECGEDVFIDVTFVWDVGTAVYGAHPGDFPWQGLNGTTREEGTFALGVCIQDALNAWSEAITRVGPQNKSYFLIAGLDDQEEPGFPWYYATFESRYYDTIPEPEEGENTIKRPPETWVPADNFLLNIELRPPDPEFNPIDIGFEGFPFGARVLPDDEAYSWAMIEPAGDSPAPPPVNIGGSVTGLTGSGLVLQNNGGDDLDIVANGDFTFATQVAAGTGYAVTVKTQPSNPAQKCTVARGSGTAPAGGVDDVLVTCTDPPVSDEVPWPAVYFVLGL